MKNRILSMLLAIVMVVGMFPGMALTSSAAPDTDYTGYYKIGNAGQLAWFACLVVGDTSQSSITEADPDAKAVLTADIDITVLGERLGKSWVGIGTADIPFTGVFDGNGYTIKGLTTDTSLSKSAVSTIPVDTVNQGLFGVIGAGGVVRDLVVEGTASVSDGIKLGAVCSENNGTIENVLSMVTVTGGDDPDAFVHTNNGTITNCYTDQSGAATGASLVTSSELEDGSVTYALGDSFGQTIGTDTQPVHYNGSNRVYQNGDSYSNTDFTVIVPVTYTVTIDENITNGTVEADVEEAAEGETVTLTITPAENYALDTLTVGETDVTDTVSDNKYTFEMPAGDVTVSATFKRVYKIIIADNIQNGTLTADKYVAAEGELVTLTATPNDGFEKGNYTTTVTGYVSISLSGDVMTMPACDVTVSVNFVDASAYKVTLPANAGCRVQRTEDTVYPVPAGGSYSFTVIISDNYEKSSNFAVLEWGDKTELYPDEDGIYTIENINKDLQIYVRGVKPKKPDSADDFSGSKYIPFKFVCGEDESHTISAPYFDVNYATCSDVYYNNNTGRWMTDITFNIKEYFENNVDGHTAADLPETAVFSALLVNPYWQYGTSLTTAYDVVEYSMTCASDTYTVTVDDTIENGTVEADVTEAAEGETVTLTITPDTDYELDTLTVKDADNGDVTVTDNKFEMPAKNVTVTATFKAIVYTVTVENGSSDSDEYKKGDTVTITANTPETGKKFAGWTSEDGVTFADSSAASTTFTMPAKAVTVKANYEEKALVTVTQTIDEANWYPDMNIRVSNLKDFFTVTKADGSAFTFYDITVSDSEDEPVTRLNNAGAYTVKFVFTYGMDKNYRFNDDTFTFTVDPLDLDTITETLSFTALDPTYTGETAFPQANENGNLSFRVNIYNVFEDETKLYSLDYDEGLWEFEAVNGKNSVEAGDAYVNVAGKTDNVTGTYEYKYTIKQAETDAPTGLAAVDETIDGKGDGKITGLTTAMEYSTSKYGTYTPVTDADMQFNDGTYYVRTAAVSANYKASEPVELTIAAGRKLSVTVPSEQTHYTLTASASELSWHGSVTLTFTFDTGYGEGDDFAVSVNGEPVTLNSGRITLEDAQEDIVVTVNGVEANEYTVSFNTNGADAAEAIVVTYGEEYGTLPSTSVTGLSGGDKIWYLVDEDGNVTGTNIKSSTVLSEARDHTLIALRRVLAPTISIALTAPGCPSDNYTYYYPENSARVLTVTVNNRNDDILSYTYAWYKNGVIIDGEESDVLTLAGNVSDSGTYKVVVTATLKSGTSIIVSSDSASGESEKKVKIMHAANTLLYDANGGEGGPSSNYSGGATITVSEAVPERTGYTFIGWNTQADGEGDSYASGDTFTFVNDNGNGGCKVTLYAVWEINEYTITFENTGDSVIAPITQDYATDVSAPQDPTRVGYNFTGWDKEIPATMPAENLTITAQWVEKADIVIDTQIQTYTYDSTDKAFEIKGDVTTGFTVEYQQNGVPVTPKTAGTYDVVITRAEDDTYKSFGTTLTGALVVTKAAPVYTVPAKITAYYGETLKNITLPAADNGTWTWKTPTDIVGNVGVQTHKAVFTPNDTVNYSTVEADVDITVSYSSSGVLGVITHGSFAPHTVKFDTNGGSEIDNVRVRRNSTLDRPDDPELEGYEFAGWYTDKELTEEYDFDDRVRENFTLYAKWEVLDDKDDEDTDGKGGSAVTDEWVNPYIDVKETHWFYDSVKYVDINGLMNGVGGSRFAPDADITRAMFVTVLYRMEGSPETEYIPVFGDVAEESYYAKAVSWAYANGVVKGVSETEFAPDMKITREQMAAMIYRYAQYHDEGFTGAWMFKLGYEDATDVSEYAYEAVCWCTMKGIIKGVSETKLDPRGTSTRAQAATVFMRVNEAIDNWIE